MQQPQVPRRQVRLHLHILDYASASSSVSMLVYIFKSVTMTESFKQVLIRIYEKHAFLWLMLVRLGPCSTRSAADVQRGREAWLKAEYRVRKKQRGKKWRGSENPSELPRSVSIWPSNRRAYSLRNGSISVYFGTGDQCF